MNDSSFTTGYWQLRRTWRLTLGQLSLVSSHTLNDAMTAVNLTLPERATVEIFAATAASGKSGETVLARHFEKAELRQREPWRAQADNFEAERAAISATAPAAQQKLFFELAKTHTMSPEHIVTSLYVMLGDDEARRFYCGNTAHKTGARTDTKPQILCGVPRRQPRSVSHLEWRAAPHDAGCPVSPG